MRAVKLPRLGTADIVRLRPAVERPQPGNTPLAFWLEREARPANEDGDGPQLVLTVLLRGSECRFRCLMCDLWRGTHPEPTPPGAILAQVQHAISASADQSPTCIKLYNAANFFAHANVPTQDLPALAESLHGFERVVVENHPRLLKESIVDFRQRLAGRLEVAMGLETIHPEVLPKLNKHMTVQDFRHASQWLRARDVDLRAFVLLRPPGLTEALGREWCQRSIDFARQLHVRHTSVIPLRAGNGAVEHLQALGIAESPRARSLEEVLNDQVGRNPDQVITADLWEWSAMRGHCPQCEASRKARLELQNLSQQPMPMIACDCEPSHTDG